MVTIRGQIAELLGLAERSLAARKAALSDASLEQEKLFGDDNDHAFRPGEHRSRGN